MRDQDYLSRVLPVLEQEIKYFRTIDLKNTLLVAVQHLCTTTYALFRALYQLKLKPENLYVIGKCYSTDPKVFNRLLEDNVNVSPASNLFNSHISYDDDFDKNIELLLVKIKSEKELNKFDKILILDDGGHLIDRALDLFPSNLNIVGIEQTSSGYNRLLSKQLKFPIINTARSWLKLKHETPIIVDLVIRKLLEKLSRLATFSNKILIIGNGAIGQQTYIALKDKFDTTVFDILKERSMIDCTEFPDHLSASDVIIGCTGSTSLQFKDFVFLKKPAILASISSSDREFDAVNFRKQLPLINNCHEDLSFNQTVLLNAGFPITFDCDYDGIDTDNFQLTRAILFSALCQAYHTNSHIKGFIDMDHIHQKRIYKNLMRLK